MLLAAWPCMAYGPEAETVLGILERRMAGGSAGREAQAAFLALLADSGSPDVSGCEAWGPGSEASEIRNRHPDLDRAITETCPESDAAASPSPSSLSADAPPTAGRFPARVRTGITHSAKPRLSTSQAPSMDQEGAFARLRWKASLREFRPYFRHAEIRLGDFSIHAGHLRSGISSTRVPFVAGAGFYEGWSGASGAHGALYSPKAALDGLGASLRSGRWTWDAAGTWNRLARTGRPDPERRDALLYVAGLARDPKRGKSVGLAEGLGFRAQAAHQRFEPAKGIPLAVTVAGAALTGRQGRLRLGLAGSLIDSGGFTGPRPGGYAEFSAATPGTDEGGFGLEMRQASPGWANPLQTPRGYLRDTVGQWFLSGRGQGGAALRARIPVADGGKYRISCHPGGAAAWTLGREELLAVEGRLAVVQEWGPWTFESGIGLYHTGSNTLSPERASGWGQTVTWRRAGWKAEASFLPRGEKYRGSRPRPLHLEITRKIRRGPPALAGMPYWTVEVLMGDACDPKRYLMLALRQEWDLSGGIRIVQGLRMPWERGGLSPEMAYQLRLEALF